VQEPDGLFTYVARNLRPGQACWPYAAHMSRTQRLVVVLVLNLGLVAGLVAVGVTAHSIAVLAEGGDYLLDAAGVAVALLAIWLAARPATRTRPGGYPNATSVAALINAGWLLILELLVAAAALDRLITHSVPVDGLPVLVMSGVAAVAMLIGALVLRGDEEDEEGGERDLSVAAVLLDTIADAATAAGVAVVGAIILATDGWYWLDPAVALTIAVVVAYHALALIRKVRTRLRPRVDGGSGHSCRG
jgi:cobalt-zinc-cadmium efflux system protein